MKPKTTEEIVAEMRAALAHHEREAAKIRAMIAAAEGANTTTVPPAPIAPKRCLCQESTDPIVVCPEHGIVMRSPVLPTPGLPFIPGLPPVPPWTADPMPGWPFRVGGPIIGGGSITIGPDAILSGCRFGAS